MSRSNEIRANTSYFFVLHKSTPLTADCLELFLKLSLRRGVS